MIDNPFTFLSTLMLIASSLVYLEYRFKWRFFEILPPIVILYFLVMSLSSIGLFEKNQDIDSLYSSLKRYILPAMIFLMLLQSDIRVILKLGKRTLFTFFLASFTISVAFIITFFLFHNHFDSSAWKAFGALSGSWLGGTSNMIAIQEALGLEDSKLGYVLLIDSIDYAIWVMILLSLVPFASKFNRWVGINSIAIEDSKSLEIREKGFINFPNIFLMLSLSLIISAMSWAMASNLPTSTFWTKTTWAVVLATVVGILAGLTPLNRQESASVLSNIMLYIIIALIASRASFTELKEAPLYIFSGFIIITIHASLMVLFGKIFKLDLFSLGVASLANIGGIASAPILAGAYNRSLIPIGILMAMVGYIIGTFVGLFVSKILYLIYINF
jgi:uncharacterized membrane protein